MGDSSLIKLGPWGNIKGNVWDDKGKNEIVQIFIWHDDKRIFTIQFQYVENGTLVLSERRGSCYGSNFDVVKLNHPSEYITWISGYRKNLSNDFDENGDLCSITFGTNRGQYGPFGGKRDYNTKDFNLRLGENRQFGGFHGTVDDYSVKSIGVYLKPNTALVLPRREH